MDENGLDTAVSAAGSRRTSQQLCILCLLSHMSESELEVHSHTEHGASWLQKLLQNYKEGSKQVSYSLLLIYSYSLLYYSKKGFYFLPCVTYNDGKI